jgi:ADP-heptose:LPS heptosyltransferase
VTDNFINLATGEASPSSNVSLSRLVVPEDAKEWLEQFRKENMTSTESKIIVVNPNAGELALERRWAKKNFIQLIRILEDEYGAAIFLIGGPDEREYTESALSEAGTTRAKNLAGRLSIPQLAALLSCADLVVTNDSGPLHIACSVGTPTISFFGPETPVLYGSMGDGHRIFFKNISCSPCINVHNAKTVRCRHGNPDCLAQISVQEVLAAIAQTLSLTPDAASGHRNP